MRAKRTAESQLGLPEYRGHSLIERIAFALLVLFVIGALLGVFGDGPLSRSIASSADGQVRVEYERFCRRVTPESLEMTVPVPRGTSAIELTINDEYLRGVQITEILPEPVDFNHQRPAGKLRFSAEDSGQSMTVRLHFRPQRAGLLDARLAVGPPGRPATVRFKQLVYP